MARTTGTKPQQAPTLNWDALTTSEKPVVVLGDSTVAVFLVAQLVRRGQTVVWSLGTGKRLVPVMPGLPTSLAMAAVVDSASELIPAAVNVPYEQGCFHRVFKNKTFRLPDYAKTPLSETWLPEQSVLGESEFRVRGYSLGVLDEQLRQQLEVHPLVFRVGALPVLELELADAGGSIQFAGGPRFDFQKLYFCDELAALKAMPKLAAALKHQAAVKDSASFSALQVVFHHSEDMPIPTDTGFVIPMNRDAGETFDRSVSGYFLDPRRSVWTVWMQAEETEENHEIMKKLRKLKQTLNRAFALEAEGASEFLKTIEREQVRFESGALLPMNQIKPSASNPDLVLMTESFGLNMALESLARHFGIEALSMLTASDLDSSSLDLSGIDLPRAHQHARGDDFSEVEAPLN